ncbi:hypothetical protein EST38_g7862 [Candolleomyces aberdarensis]|uniref:G domain-containing protein n=1 Tax=Candolleomyces aberdarensis TaxID=2316362 RepID=A0A4Q2DFW3_9AGAR|nr:hypothetical protein EST38_g7862 [Candolleomyces aberdarensis]
MENPKKTIAIVGDSGVGKSAFINALFGEEVAQVSSGTCMCTRTIEEFSYERKDGLVLSLVDTPGFNGYDQDSKDVKTDTQILQMMSDFLNAQRGKLKSFTGIVFLHSITTSSSLPQNSRKFMRTFKRLCGDGLKNVVVVTTRWDESCDDEEALHEAETAEQSLLESPGFLKDLSDAGVQFFRTGHFGGSVPQPSRDQYQPPSTIVERLLGLQTDGADNQERYAVEGETIQEPDNIDSQEQGVEGMAIQGHGVGFEPEKVDIQEQAVEGEAIQGHDASLELHVVDIYEQAVEGKAMQDPCDAGPLVPVNEPGPPKQDLSGYMEHIWKTLEDLKSATKIAKSEQVETNEDLKRRVDKWEGFLGEFFAQWRALEDRQKSSIADQLVSFGAKQEQELKSAHSEMLEASRKVCDDLSAGWQSLQERERKLNDDLNEARMKTVGLHADKAMLLQELNAVKSALAEQMAQLEIMKVESGSIYVSGLRSQLEEVKDDRDLVKVSKLETELELEKTREVLKVTKEELETQALELCHLRDQVQSRTIESDLRNERITSLETEVEEGRKRSEQLAQESACLRDQVQAKSAESELYTQQIASLKEELEECHSIKASQLGTLERARKELEESKEGLEHEARRSARLKKQVRVKTTESELQTQRIASLEMELAAKQKSSEKKVQALTHLKRRLQDETQRVASLETQLEDGEKRSQELVQEATLLKDRFQAKITESELHTQQIASLQMELVVEQESSEKKVQALTRLTRQLHDVTRRIASLETELEDGKKKSQEVAQEATCLKSQVRAKTTESELNMRRIASLEKELAVKAQNLKKPLQERLQLAYEKAGLGQGNWVYVPC